MIHHTAVNWMIGRSRCWPVGSICSRLNSVKSNIFRSTARLTTTTRRTPLHQVCASELCGFLLGTTECLTMCRTLDIAPVHARASRQKRLDMARIVNGSHSFSCQCHPTRLSTHIADFSFSVAGQVIKLYGAVMSKLEARG